MVVWIGGLVILGVFLIQNWLPWVTVVVLGRPWIPLPLTVLLLLALVIGFISAWGIRVLVQLAVRSARPVGPASTAKGEVLEPDEIEYPATYAPRPASQPDDWAVEEWDMDWEDPAR